MTKPETDRRAQWASALWEAAEQNTIAECICCDPIDPKHGLCVAGGKALEMLRALIVDDPEAYKPAPLTTLALELAAAVSVPPPAPRPDDRAALRDRIAEALLRWAERGNDPQYASMRRPETVRANAYSRADAVLAVLPEPADAPAAECSAQNHNYESGPRLCIRAAQHHGDHIDERGFHWSDTVAVYPLGDGTFRTGVNLRAALRRLAAVSGPCVAGEQQNETPEAERPARPECAHCWREIENRGTPNMGGPQHDNWVHVPGGFTVCFPQRGADSPRAEPRAADEDAPSKEPHPTEADLRHALATLDRFQSRGTAETPQTETLPKRPPMDARRLLGIDACPTPLTHNLGCGCPTDQTPAVVAQPAEDPS